MKFKEYLVVIAIAVLFSFFVGYGIEVFDDSPSHDDYCPNRLYDINNQAECEAEGGLWNQGLEPKPVVEGTSEVRGLCQPSRECYNEFDLARAKHNKIVFIVSIVLGIAAILVGVFLKKDLISTGLTAGGVLLLLYGTIRYWQHAANLLKFVLLGISLAVVIWITYKRLDK